MDNSERKPLWAKVQLTNVLVPLDQLYIFESCMQIESEWISRDDVRNAHPRKESYTEEFVREIPKLPSVELMSHDQVIALQVKSKLFGR